MNKKHGILALLSIVIIIIIVSIVIFVLQKTDNRKENIPQDLQTQQTDNTIQNESIPFESALDNPAFADDIDRDGISNADEALYGTSSEDFDTDGDGIDDKKEIDVFKTDPTNPDTDGDGFWDGIELINGYNPTGDGKLVP